MTARRWLAGFIRANKALCYRLENLLAPVPNAGFRDAFIASIPKGAFVADVGGGKKPLFTPQDGLRASITYEGLDYDADELAAAPDGFYDATHVVDITTPPAALAGRYDFIICRNTLEHVTDAPGAMAGLSDLLAADGRLYIKAPCRHALFARLNIVLPEGLKRRLLFFISPSKIGDGFPAYYLGCDPGSIANNAQAVGLLAKTSAERNYRSSYFTFFLPVYLVWRLITAAQYMLQRNYCESFEIVLEKPALSGIAHHGTGSNQLVTQ